MQWFVQAKLHLRKTCGFLSIPLWVFSGTVQERIDEVLREMSAGNEENEEDEEA